MEQERNLNQEEQKFKFQETGKNKDSAILSTMSLSKKKTSKKKTTQKDVIKNLEEEEEKETNLVIDEFSNKEENIINEKDDDEIKEEEKVEKEKVRVSLAKSMGSLDKMRVTQSSKEEVQKNSEENKIALKKASMIKSMMRALHPLRMNNFLTERIKALGVTKKGSESYREMMDAANDLNMLLEKQENLLKTKRRNAVIDLDEEPQAEEEKVEEIPMERFMEVLTRLSEACRGYYHEHRGYRFHEYGKERKALAETLLHHVDLAFKSIVDKKMEKEIQLAIGADSGGETYTKAEYKTAKAKCEELAKMKKKWSKHIARNDTSADPEVNLQERMNLFLAYEEHLKIYRSQTMPSEMDREVMLMFDEYERVLREVKTREWVLKNMSSDKNLDKKQSIEKIVNKHVAEEDEREEKVPLNKELDKSLTKEQLKGIAEIDQWLINNFNNGGMLFFIPLLRNHHGDYVSRVLRLSKRERLHMYYLIEKKIRRNGSPLDTFLSQKKDYVPNLKDFKEQMLSGKLKVVDHATGTYTHMYKLSEALQMVEQKDTREALELAVHLNEEQEKEEKKKDNIDNDKDDEDKNLEALSRQRLLLFAQTNAALVEYKECLTKLKNASKKEKPKIEAESRLLAMKAQKVIKELVDCDDKFPKMEDQKKLNAPEAETSNVAHRKYDERNDYVDNAGTDSSIVGGVIGKVIPAAKYGKYIGITFGLGDYGWKNIDLGAGIVSGEINLVSGIIQGVNSLYNLITKHEDMTSTEIFKTIADTGKFFTDAVTGGMNVVKSFATYIGTSPFLSTMTSMVSVAGLVSAGFQFAKAGIQLKDVEHRNENLVSARSYFDKKQMVEKGKTPEEIKQWRQTKYEKGMLKLAESLKNRESHSALFTSISAGIGVCSSIIPGVGASVFGAIGVGWGIAAGALTSYFTTKAHTSSFDHYFNMDKVTEDVWQHLQKKYPNKNWGDVNKTKETLRERLRTRVAASAGFDDVSSAQDHIAKKYAEYVHSRLFGKEEERAEGEEHEAFIKLVKSFGLKYDEKKKKPTIEMLQKKML